MVIVVALMDPVGVLSRAVRLSDTVFLKTFGSVDVILERVGVTVDEKFLLSVVSVGLFSFKEVMADVVSVRF